MGFDSGIFSLTIYYCLTETFSISKFASTVFGQTQFFESIGGNRVFFIQRKVGFGQTKVVSMTCSTKELIASKTLLFFNAEVFFNMLSLMGVSFNKYTLFERCESIK